jgi:hypothetical protein
MYQTNPYRETKNVQHEKINYLLWKNNTMVFH